MSKISLLHPSRGRAQKAFDTLQFWLSKANGPANIEHILSIDSDDVEKFKYMELFKNSTVLVNHNSNVVQATNHAACEATGDIMIYMSDDFFPPDEWDEKVQNSFDRIYFTEGIDAIACVKVDDGLQPMHVRVMTIPIINRALYLKLGFFWHPGYFSMFCDQWMYEVCDKNGWLFLAIGLVFQHKHPANGLAENDETYRRSAENWNQGKALFEKHQAEGFPL